MYPSINPGDLNNLGQIQALPAQKARAADGSERRDATQWALFAEAWFKMDSKGGKEFYAAKSVNASLTHELTVYWQPGITSKMRMYFPDPVEGTDRFFDIQDIVNPTPGRRWMLLLHCRELVGREATT